MRVELYSSGNLIVAPENQNFYNVYITMHGLLMIFFLVMPGLFGGFGNCFVPIFNGSPEVVYLRISNLSTILLALLYVAINTSCLTGALLMVLSDLQSNTLFFDPTFGGIQYCTNIFSGSSVIQKYIS